MLHAKIAFNDVIKAYFVTVTVKQERYEVLTIYFDNDNKYGYGSSSQNNSGDMILSMLETEWFYHHERPSSYSTDPEISKGLFSRF